MKTKKESQLSKNNNGEIVLNGTRVRYVPQVGILGIVASRREIFNCREKARFSSENYRNYEIWFRYEYEVIVIRRKYRKSEKFVVRKPVIKLHAYHINPDEVIPSGAVVWVEPSPQLDCFMIINWGEEVEFCSGSSSGVRLDVPIRICVENLSGGQPGGGSGGGGNIRTKTEYLPVYLPRGSILDWDNIYCVTNEQNCCGGNSSVSISNCDLALMAGYCHQYSPQYEYTRFNMEDGSGNTIGCKVEWRVLDFTITSGNPNIRINPADTRGYLYAHASTTTTPYTRCLPPGEGKCKWFGCVALEFPGEMCKYGCTWLVFDREARSALHTHICNEGILIGRVGNVYRYRLSGSANYYFAYGPFDFNMVYEIVLVGPGGGGGSNPGGGGGTPGDGGGSNQVCCPPGNSLYVLQYITTVFGESYHGVTNASSWNNNGGWATSYEIPNSPCVLLADMECDSSGLVINNLGFYCNGSYCLFSPSDLYIRTTGCPGSPTFYLTILPGRCASGTFILRPAGPGEGGDGGSNQHCCPPNGRIYLAEYDFAVIGETLSGQTGARTWSTNEWGHKNFRGLSIIPSSTLCQGSELYIDITVNCELDRIVSTLNIYCNNYVICQLSFDSLDPEGSDFDLTVTNCPYLPTFNFTIKPGRCVSGTFILRPTSTGCCELTANNLYVTFSGVLAGLGTITLNRYGPDYYYVTNVPTSACGATHVSLYLSCTGNGFYTLSIEFYDNQGKLEPTVSVVMPGLCGPPFYAEGTGYVDVGSCNGDLGVVITE